MVTISFILYPCHLLWTPTSLTLSCPPGRVDGCLHAASPAGSWGRRAATKAVPHHQVTSFTASIMVDKIPSGKLHPYNGIRPVGKGERKEKQKGQIIWVTWFTKSPVGSWRTSKVLWYLVITWFLFFVTFLKHKWGHIQIVSQLCTKHLKERSYLDKESKKTLEKHVIN